MVLKVGKISFFIKFLKNSFYKAVLYICVTLLPETLLDWLIPLQEGYQYCLLLQLYRIFWSIYIKIHSTKIS